MKIEKGYDDELQSIMIDSGGMIFHLMVEPETLSSWEYGLIILGNFIEYPMEWHIGMDHGWYVGDTGEENKIEFNLGYQDEQWSFQISMLGVEIWLMLDKKEILYFAGVLKDCIENVKKSLLTKIG